MCLLLFSEISKLSSTPPLTTAADWNSSENYRENSQTGESQICVILQHHFIRPLAPSSSCEDAGIFWCEGKERVESRSVMLNTDTGSTDYPSLLSLVWFLLSVTQRQTGSCHRPTLLPPHITLYLPGQSFINRRQY